jgi:hypothetical protein
MTVVVAVMAYGQIAVVHPGPPYPAEAQISFHRSFVSCTVKLRAHISSGLDSTSI